MQVSWTRIFPAVITPFREDLSIDIPALEKQIDMLIGAGCAGISVNGSVGENYALTPEEKRLVVKTAVQVCAGRVPMVAGVAELTTDLASGYARDVAEIGADFYSLLVYKWMYGPYTAGALYINKAWQQRLQVMPSSANYFSGEGARRFEFATVPPAYYHASAAATDYLLGLGIDNIETYVNRLAQRFRQDLAAIPGLVIENPADPAMCTGVVTFRVEGVDGPHISTQLRGRKIITRPTGLKFSGVRASVSFFTTEAEIDTFVAAVAEIVDGN